MTAVSDTATPPADAPPSAPNRKSRRSAVGCGCLGAILLAFLVAEVPTLTSASRARASVQPGMSAAEVFERTGEAFVTELSPKGTNRRLQVFGTALTGDGRREAFATRGELGRAVEARMKQEPATWTASFGFVTMVPRRTYFTVEFGADARVTSVSGTAGGALD